MANLPYFVAEYIHPSFRLDTPSPYSAGSPWGLLSRKIFLFFKTLFQLVKFSLGIPYQLLSFLVLYSFDYDLDLLHIVEYYGFDIISRFRIFDSKFLLVF